MILYFTGTGNSLYAAKNLLPEDEELISMADLLKEGKREVELKKDEPLGLVFPVYFYTIPSIVRDFLKNVEFKNAGYVYSVITCGGGTGQASAVLFKLLKEKGITLSYFKELLMPDNSMLFYQIPGVEEGKGRLNDALTEISAIKSDIASKKTNRIKSGTILSDVLGVGYKMCSGTKKFYAEASCIGCGLCERNCPENAIKLVDNKPIWQKDKCCKCSSCINRCPVQAIQYGKGTKNRNRYVNPFTM